MAPTPPAPPGEARHTTVASLRDPSLLPYLATLRDHFERDAGASRGPFLVQRSERAGGGEALLVSRGDESEPIVLAVDRDHVVFAKQRPVAGIVPPVVHLSIAPGPERGVALFAYVPSEGLVAARMWADDANPFAEIVVLTTDACDALTSAWSPGLGWIVACATKSGTRVQRLREDLTSAWGKDGLVVGQIGPVGRAGITFESPSTWTLTQRARAVGGDRTLTFRYDDDAEELSPQPTPSSSTSNTRVAPGGMTGGKPRDP